MKYLTFIQKNIEIVVFIILTIILVVYFSVKTFEGFYNESHGINSLDAIIYINLENRSDRKELILKDLENIKTDMSKVNKVSGIYIPKNGHKGCIQSHILALDLAQLNNWEKILILEDDAEIKLPPDEFNSTLDQIFSKLNETNTKWDVIMLGACNKKYDEKSPKIQINDKNSIQRVTAATCSHAYIINGQYRNNILNLFKTCNDNMKRDKLNDPGFEPYALDQKWSGLQEKNNWFCLENDIIVQRNIWSTIINESHS